MKFAVSYNTAFHGADPDTIVDYARHAEDCGFEALYLSEHIVLYPGAKAGPMEFPPTLPFLDPLDCLAYVAAATRRILLGTGVLLLPYHHPVTLAKRLATVDVLSKGRMRLLTVGIGVLPGEAAAVGVDFASRGRRADEAIDVLRLLWAGGEDGVSHTGDTSPSTACAASPSLSGPTASPFMSADRAVPPPAAGARGDGYSPAAPSTRRSARPSGSSRTPPPPRQAATRRRWSTPGGSRWT